MNLTLLKTLFVFGWVFVARFGSSQSASLGCDHDGSETLSCSATSSYIVVRNQSALIESGSQACAVEFPRIEGSCQILVEFLEFNLAPPSLATGLCTNEGLRISGSASVRGSFAICGANAGQQIHLSYGNGERIQMEFTTPLNGQYRMRVSHIQCNSSQLAPIHCLQYHTTTAGTVRSFAYGSPGMVAGQYTICVRDFGNSQQIEWSECDAVEGLRSQFFLSNFFVAHPIPTGTPPAPAPPNRFGMTGRYCDGNSFVEVVGEARHCGARFTVELLRDEGQIPVTSQAKPYQLFVNIGHNNYTRPPWVPVSAATITPSFPYPEIGYVPEAKPCAMFGGGTAWPVFPTACQAPSATNGWQCSCPVAAAPLFGGEHPQRTGFCLKYALL